MSKRGCTTTLLQLSTESVCFRTVVLIFCFPFSVLVHRVMVCWISIFRSMAGHVASVPFCHNTVLTCSPVSPSWCSWMSSSDVCPFICSFDGMNILSILCGSQLLSTCWQSPAIWIGCANDNDDFRDVIDMLSIWFGWSCDELLLAVTFDLLFVSLSPWSDIWMQVSFAFAFAFEVDWITVCVSVDCCWAWWGANC